MPVPGTCSGSGALSFAREYLAFGALQSGLGELPFAMPLDAEQAIGARTLLRFFEKASHAAAQVSGGRARIRAPRAPDGHPGAE
jgi:hypothetical protein